MFDRLTKKFAEKMGQSVQQAAVPITTEMKKTVNSKVDLYSKILRLGVLVLLFVDGTKRVSDAVRNESSAPNQIVINNYLGPKGE